MSAKLDERRQQLYQLNHEAWSVDGVFATSNKLDSSLKKNTAFIKKVRVSINADQYKNIIKDIQTVSLEKYLEEIIAALTEGLFKVSKSDDIAAALEIVSALHQRFRDSFTPYLFRNFVAALSTHQMASAETSDEIKVRQKNLVRLLFEFYLVDLFRDLSNCSQEGVDLRKISNEFPVADILRENLQFRFKQGNSLALAVSFVKRFKHLLLADSSSELLKNEYRQELVDTLKKYTEAVLSKSLQLYKKTKKLERDTKKASIHTGRISETMLSELEELQALFEKFKDAGEQLASAMGMEFPSLEENQDDNDGNAATVQLVKSKSLNEDDLDGIWSEVKEKNFYTKISSLEDLLAPQIENDFAEDTRSDGEKLTQFLEKLSRASYDDIDQLTVEFHALNINNKATRNKLFKSIQEASVSNLKYYCKFLRINQEPLQDVLNEVIESVDNGFKSQIYHNSISFKNIYIFVELVKFKLLPQHSIFHKIRTLTLKIGDNTSLDILTLVFDNIGRFLLREPEYSQLMKEMIGLLKFKQKKISSINDKMTMKNMLITIDPPVITVKKTNNEGQKLTPHQQFLHQLILQLNPGTITAVKSVFKDLGVPSEELRGVMLDSFSTPESLSYDNIPSLANLLASTKKFKYHRWLKVHVVDTVIENIKRGLDLNDYRSNRIRMSQIKYLAELYNFGIVSFKLLVDILYKILCYGHPNNQPLPGNGIETDLSNNYFRIQMCCCLLMSINGVFEGSGQPVEKKSKKKTPESAKNVTPHMAKGVERKNSKNVEALDVFLVFFQYYIFCKSLPLPIEVEFQLSDVYTKYESVGEVRRFDSLKETIAELQAVIVRKGLRQDNEDDEDEDNEDEDNEEDNEDDEDVDNNEDEDIYASEDSVSESEDSDSDVDEEQQIDFQRTIDDETTKFEEEMEREYQRMVSASYEMSKINSASRRLNIPNVANLKNDDAEAAPTGQANMSFKLLTKSGKKAGVKQVSIPTDNKFAETILKEREDQKQHKQKIMNLVLSMNE